MLHIYLATHRGCVSGNKLLSGLVDIQAFKLQLLSHSCCAFHVEALRSILELLVSWKREVQAASSKPHRQDQVFALTFQAARSPQARVGHHLLVLLAGLVLAHGLGPADAAGVQPVVCPDCDGHEAEGRECSHRGQQHLDSAVEQTHVSAFHERGTPFPLDVQEVNIWKFAGPHQTEKTGYTRAEGEGRRRRRMR